MIFSARVFLYSTCIFLALALYAPAATVNATWNTAADVPVSASSYTATGNTVDFTLNFAPPTGTPLTVVNNTGLPFISGTFDNLAQGQGVNLSYNGVTYPFVANYYGGTGNDLVLVWAASRPVAWGNNSSGGLGNNSLTNSSIPAAMVTAGTPLDGRFLLALATGDGSGLALCSDGTLASWGSNLDSQLGSNAYSLGYVTMPVPVTTAGTPLEGKRVVALSVGGTHDLVLCSDGTLASWGNNYYGQLGNSSTISSALPVAVKTASTPLAGRPVVAIRTGNAFSLVLCGDGTLAAWGDNSWGQLGNNTTSKSSVPAAVTTAGTPLEGKTVVAVAAGNSHSLALCSDGTLAAWGHNYYGQLGNNTTSDSSVPVVVTTAGTPLEGKTVVAVAAGSVHSLVLCADGTLAAWGNNQNGQLGNNSTTNSSIPVAVSMSGVLAGKTIAALLPGGGFSAVCCTDGTVAAWGYGGNGQLGNNSTANSSIPVAVSTSPLASGERIMLAASGSYADCTLGLVAMPYPAVSTVEASSVGTTTAVLNGTLNANGGTTAVSFDYGLDTTYGTHVAGSPATLTSSSPAAVTATLTGLTPNTIYHFRVNGTSGSAIANGSDFTFTTLDGNLSELSLSAGSLSPAFTPKVYSYQTAVDAAVSSIAITPTTSDSQATVAVNGTPVISGSASSPVPLGYGDNTVNIVVTASDHTSTVTYALIVTREVPAEWTVTYASAADVPPTFSSFTATGGSVDFALGYAPVPGTVLPVVTNTRRDFINGTFDNLAQGQVVNLSYNGVTYPFVASYYGGTGNDLVLVWAGNRPVAWGYNNNGQLGNNDTTDSSLPVAVTTADTPLAGRTLLALSAGNKHTLALCSDGTLAAWGYNADGELGNSMTDNSSLPVAVTTAGTPLEGKTVVAVATGNSHSLALCSDGTLAAWGYNYYGQLGNNTTTNSGIPVAVTTAGTPLAGKTVIAVAAGSVHSLVLCSDGTLAAWGYNYYGQLGNNTTTNSSIPVAVTTVGTPLAGKSVISVASGSYHNIALCSDGTLVAWGANGNGQLGNNSTTQSTVPVAVTTAGTVLAGKTVIAVAAGSLHSLALCSDGTLAAWGSNTYGQLGNNSTTQSKVPVTVDTSGVLAGKTMVGLNAGFYHSVAWCSDGTLSAWGDNTHGQLGNNSTTQSNIPVTVDTSALATGETFIQVASGSSASQTLGLVATPLPTAATWNTAMDVPVSASSYTATGNRVELTLNFAPPPGTNLTVVNNTGLAFIRGTFDNLAQGQAVNLSFNGTTYPFVASYYGGTGNDLVLVWAGNRPVAWGSNYAGKLGNGTTTSSSTPVAVSTAGTPLAGRTLLAFAAGFQHSLAVCADGSLVSWGANNAGQLGNGTTTNSRVPQAVPTAGTPLEGKTVVAVSAGFFNSVALCSDGTLATWGADASTNSMTPVAVPTAGTPLEGRSVVAIATTGYLYVVLCSDGTLAAWGSNTNGELGNGTTTNSSVPVAVTTAGTPLQGKTVVSIAVGAGFNLALCADGTLVAWGYNANGQLGNGTTTSSSVPVAVTMVGTPLEGKTVIAVAAGVSHSLALCSDGTVAAWGYNSSGQLGNNSTYDSSVPVAVVSSGVLAGKTIIGLNAGYSQSLARCTDGTLAAWGQNSTTQNNIPVAVDTSSLAPAESIVLVASGTYATHTLGLVASPIPAAITIAASSVAATTVVLNGTVNANDGTATVSFDYGLDSSYGTNVAGAPAFATGSSATAVSTTLSGLAPGTTYHFRANGGISNGTDLTFTTLSLLQNWRLTSFGTTASSGTLADAADYDGDGIPNLVEYALNLSPTTASRLPMTTAVNGANFEYTYSRSTAAVNAGTAFAVEWSGVLPAAWSSNGVTQTVLSDDGTTQVVKAVIPANAAITMFARLSVTAPP